MTARLKLRFGMPWRSIDTGDTALWPSDRITILKRVGSRYLCKVEYGHSDYPAIMFGFIHKRLVRVLK
jgi:hypothetical protein